MPRFPRTEADIAALALLVVEGLEQAPEDFPSPPVPAADLRAKLDAANAASTAAVAAETAAQEQHAAKDDAIEDLIDCVKADLKYAEFAVREQPEKLSRLGTSRRCGGWCGRLVRGCCRPSSVSYFTTTGATIVDELQY